MEIFGPKIDISLFFVHSSLLKFQNGALFNFKTAHHKTAQTVNCFKEFKNVIPKLMTKS